MMSLRVMACVLGAALAAPAVVADVEVEQKTKIEMPGVLGGVYKMFGGKSAREGMTSRTVVQGDRKLTVTGDDGELVDLGDEKIYNIDFKKKTYAVMTFDEWRQKMREQMDAMKEQRGKEPQPDQPEWEVDFDIKDTGQKQAINGFDTHEVLMTATVHPKGQTAQEGGGGVLRSSLWLGPKIAAMKEIEDFDMRFVKAMKLEELIGGREAMMALANSPALSKAMEEFRKKKVDMSGTAVRTELKFDAVAPPGEAAQEAEGEQEEGGLGGMLRGLGKKLGKKKGEEPAGGKGAGPGSQSLMTSTTEILRVSTEVAANATALPAGFRQVDR